MSERLPFLSGVIEGFYGPPWTHAERLELFRWMSGAGLNTYLYGPKDDLKHRAIWREAYTSAEAAELQQVIAACQGQGLRFVYALGPGLDLRYSRPADLECLRARFEQMLQLGCDDFCLLFDDIPDVLDPADLAKWGSLAAAQCAVTHELFHWVRRQRPGSRFFFCPTPYCGRMAAAELGGREYLEILGRELHPDIDIFWTGPEIISREVDVPHIAELGRLLRRQPVLWDNLMANDYDGRRVFLGPLAGRPRELKGAIRGLLINPNVEFPLNFVAIRTLGDFLEGDGPWDARAAYLAAMEAWLPAFATVGQPVLLADLILFGDCYYLPYESGPEAADLFSALRDLLGRDAADWGEAATPVLNRLARLRDFCVRLTELKQRAIFHALYRRAWELREELDLVHRYIYFKSKPENAQRPFHSDFHRPLTYRGGWVGQLQQLLSWQAAGSLAAPPKGALHWPDLPTH